LEAVARVQWFLNGGDGSWLRLHCCSALIDLYSGDIAACLRAPHALPLPHPPHPPPCSAVPMLHSPHPPHTLLPVRAAPTTATCPVTHAPCNPGTLRAFTRRTLDGAAATACYCPPHIATTHAYYIPISTYPPTPRLPMPQNGSGGELDIMSLMERKGNGREGGGRKG